MKSGDASEYQLPERLDTATVASVFTDLMERRGQALSIDGTAVRMLGAHCAELLLAATHTWRQDGVTLTFSGASRELLHDLDLLGLSLRDLASPESTQ
ncbi:MAG: STAS domain-containing protein [Beijerinckiaceae bacterium]